MIPSSGDAISEFGILRAWKIEWHTVGRGLGHLSSVLTSSHSCRGDLLQFRDFLGKRAPVDLGNVFAGTVAGHARVRVWEDGWGALFEDSVLWESGGKGMLLPRQL